jgi:G:T/U-mismatch repair DNA glycosylase
VKNTLKKQGIAMYDVAKSVVRHKDNASDKDLEVIETIDIAKTIQTLPCLQNIVVTGQKALEVIIEQFVKENITITPPTVGKYSSFIFENRTLRLYRMPSSSRAYPLALEKKAAVYGEMFLMGNL